MKQIILLVLTAGSCYSLFNYVKANKEASNGLNTDVLQYEQCPYKTAINTVYFQDASRSISRNGVELIHASVFDRYFTETGRDIQIHFGIVNDQTAKKLITVTLKKPEFRKPLLPELENVSFSRQNSLKREYAVAYQAYQQDSVKYYTNRKDIFSQFCKQVDSAVAPYRDELSNTTDLVPAIQIADKAFNYSFSDNALNFLLINSDGFDSYGHQPEPIRNKAEVILINANGNTKTSIDKILTRTLQSTEQAIDFSLNNHN